MLTAGEGFSLRPLRLFLAGLLLLSVLTSVPAALADYTPEEKQLLEAYQTGELLRLHILADSDEPEAQRIKLAVRDAVLARFGGEWSEAITADEAFARLCSLLPQIETLARETVRRSGFDWPVSAEAGLLTLPEKRYGQIVLPEGNYRGLRLTIGSGEGRNWWCILFPQLCLALADEAPWVSPSAASAEGLAEETAAPTPEFRWDSLRVLRCWLLWPSAADAANVAHPEGDQGH